MVENNDASSDRNGKMKLSRGRKIVAAACFALIVAGIGLGLGTGSYSALGFGSIAALCPLGWLETVVAGREFMLHPFILLLVAVALIVVFGKAFCSWACPAPHIQRLLRPARKDAEMPIVEKGPSVKGDRREDAVALDPVRGERDGLRIDSRHAVLAGALGSAAIFGFPVFCILCPVGLTFATVAGIWHLFQFSETTWGLLVFPAILVLELVFLRSWCHRFCPLSALMSLISSANRTFKVKVDEEKCLRGSGVDCRSCVTACPEKLDPHTGFIPECTKCGDCIGTCPAQAISISLLSKRGERDRP